MTDSNHRRSIRLPHYDYASYGPYFVTICAYQRLPIFERASAKDQIESIWNAIPQHFDGVITDEFVVMPNHVHGIVVITRDVGAQHAAPLRGLVVQSGSLSAIVRAFKSAVTREMRLQGLWDDRPLWQRNYYERIIRNDDELERIRHYIKMNPVTWLFDQDNPEHAESSDHTREWGWLEDHEARE